MGKQERPRGGIGEGTSFPCSTCGPPQPAHGNDGSEEQSGVGSEVMVEETGFVPAGSVGHRAPPVGPLTATSQTLEAWGGWSQDVTHSGIPCPSAILSALFKKKYVVFPLETTFHA